MNEKEKEALQDVKAFIDFAVAQDMPFLNVLGTLGHDIGGLLDGDKFFLPRTHGYAGRVTSV